MKHPKNKNTDRSKRQKHKTSLQQLTETNWYGHRETESINYLCGRFFCLLKGFGFDRTFPPFQADQRRIYFFVVEILPYPRKQICKNRRVFPCVYIYIFLSLTISTWPWNHSLCLETNQVPIITIFWFKKNGRIKEKCKLDWFRPVNCFFK